MKMRNAFWMVFAASAAWGAGFEIDTHDARATGMGTAMKGHVDDASAVLYNPAGLAQGRTIDVQLGTTLIYPALTYQPPSGGSKTTTSFDVTAPPHVFASIGIDDDLAFGLGFFIPFGLVVPWPKGWVGQQEIELADLKTYYINPSVAFRLWERVRIGGGLQIIRATAELKKAIGLGDRYARVDLAGGGWAYGGNVGVMVEVIPQVLSLGATYRAQADVKINGRAHFSDVPAEQQRLLQDQGVSTTLKIPGTFGVGFAVWPIPALRLAADADYTGWQRITDLTIDFDNPALTSVLPKGWKYAWNFHFGGEYTFNPQWRFRLGAIIDPTPSPQNTLTPDVPDSNRIDFSAGAGYRWNNFNFDAGYMLVIFTGQTSTYPVFNGTYGGIAHLLSASVGFHL